MIEHLKYLYDNFDKLTEEENFYLTNIINKLINNQKKLEKLEKNY